MLAEGRRDRLMCRRDPTRREIAGSAQLELRVFALTQHEHNWSWAFPAGR